MANKRGKEVDTTYLSVNQAERRGFIHRDYIAHCLRWSHVVAFLMRGHRYKTAHVLDVGCGRELPLAHLMFSSKMTHTTGTYTGVDAGPIDQPDIRPKKSKFDMRLNPLSDFSKLAFPIGAIFDVVTCFEVLEHVEPYHAWRMLKKMREVTDEHSSVFISTPNYDPDVGAADNHVNEMSWRLVLALTRAAGFECEARYGTFASQRDYKNLLNPEWRKLFDRLTDYYDSNLVACIFAPLFPEQSRNILWHLRPSKANASLINDKFTQNDSSSDRLEEDLKKIRKEAR